MPGDFNGDGIDDLAFSSPHDEPFGRKSAGTLHIVLGRDSVWPAISDLALPSFPDSSSVQIVNVYGARGSIGSDTGDTLAYSGAAGDLNGDGVDDIIINEMVGNGVAPGTVDVGNLIILDGQGMVDYQPPVSNGLCFPVRTVQGSFVVICLD